jgi:hypothetical protein
VRSRWLFSKSWMTPCGILGSANTSCFNKLPVPSGSQVVVSVGFTFEQTGYLSCSPQSGHSCHHSHNRSRRFQSLVQQTLPLGDQQQGSCGIFSHWPRHEFSFKVALIPNNGLASARNARTPNDVFKVTTFTVTPYQELTLPQKPQPCVIQPS